MSKIIYFNHLHLKINQLSKFINKIIQGIVNASSKNAATNGTTKKAFCEYPYLSVIDVILASAVGVAPNPCPISPLIITAESKFLPSILNTTKIEYKTIKIAWHITIISIGPNNLDNLNKSMLISAIVKNIPKDKSLRKSIILKSKFIILILSFTFLKTTDISIHPVIAGIIMFIKLKNRFATSFPKAIQRRIDKSCSKNENILRFILLSIFFDVDTFLEIEFGFNLYLSIKNLARGEPISPANIRPKVDAAIPTLIAFCIPKLSIVAPYAAEDPWPPSIEIVPHIIPSKGFMPINFDIITAIVF